MASDRVEVDPDALDGLASRISRVHESLTTAKMIFSDPYGGVQSRTVEDALEYFNASWNQHRGHLVDELDSAAQALGGAAESFRSDDHQLADALKDKSTRQRD
jgi:uncharacterized protein YukE